jgi:hypothetical protein
MGDPLANFTRPVNFGSPMMERLRPMSPKGCGLPGRTVGPPGAGGDALPFHDGQHGGA